jgi:hypothetical protein
MQLMAEVAIVGSDIQEVIGSAIASEWPRPRVLNWLNPPGHPTRGG